MMLEPPMNQLLEQVPSRYMLVEGQVELQQDE